MDVYPAGTVRQLLETNAVTEPTRDALEKRLSETENYQPRFFDAPNFALLDTVCRRLIIQDENSEFVDCAAFIDKSLSESDGDGWRYDKLPNDAETFRRGLGGIDETAQNKFSAEFIRLRESQQDEVLTEIENGKAAGETWETLSAELFFEELLAKAVEVYYAHPVAQERIGYVGMADAPGWTQIKLDEREPREPQKIGER